VATRERYHGGTGAARPPTFPRFGAYRMPMPVTALRRTAGILGRMYAVAAFAVLFLAVALDRSFSAHFEGAYTYTTPVRGADLASIVGRSSFADLLSDGWLTPFIALAAVTLVLVVARVPVPAFVRIAIALPQLLLVIVAPWGAFALAGDLASFLSGTLDGEWLHEGWPIMEAAAVWVPVPVAIAGGAIRELWQSSRR
jgi:hypothetical protein